MIPFLRNSTKKTNIYIVPVSWLQYVLSRCTISLYPVHICKPHFFYVDFHVLLLASYLAPPSEKLAGLAALVSVMPITGTAPVLLTHLRTVILSAYSFMHCCMSCCPNHRPNRHIIAYAAPPSNFLCRCFKTQPIAGSSSGLVSFHV